MKQLHAAFHPALGLRTQKAQGVRMSASKPGLRILSTFGHFDLGLDDVVEGQV